MLSKLIHSGLLLCLIAMSTGAFGQITPPVGGGGGGGATTYTGLTDAATAALPTLNTPLSNALGLKAPLISPAFSASAPIIQPNTLPGIKAWYKADSIVQSDASAIATWADSSGNGNTATGVGSPIVKNAIINGLPVVRLDGSTQYFTLAGVTLTQTAGSSAFFVVKPTSTSLEEIYVSDAAGSAFYLQNAGFWQFVGVRSSTGILPAFQVLEVNQGSIANSTASLVQNGNLVNGVVTANGSTGTSVTYTLIGKWGGGTVFKFGGDIAEIILFDGGLSETNKQAVRTYLNNKYAITITNTPPPLPAKSVLNASLATTGQTLSNGAQLNSSGLFFAGSAFKAFGDSITANISASSVENGYVSQLARATGMTATNSGASGALLEDNQITDSILAAPVSSSSISTLLCCMNNALSGGADAAKQSNFLGNLYAGMAWLAIPAGANKLIGQSAAITYAGTWTNSTNYGGAIEKTSSANGATATASVYGKTVYIATTRTNAGSGVISVTVDGVAYGSFNCFGTTTSGTRTYAPYLIRIPGLSNAVHSVVVTVVGSNAAYVLYVSGSGGTTYSTGPFVFLGNTIRQPNYTVSNSATVTANINQMIRSVVSDLTADGLSVSLVDADSHYVPSTDTAFDNIHPTDLGHKHIAEAFLEKFSVFSSLWSRNNSVDMISRQGATTLTGQTATLAATSLCPGTAACQPGLYRATLYVTVTTANASSTITPTISWNDGTAARTCAGSALDSSTTSYATLNCGPIKVDGLNNISVSTTVVNTPTYSLDVVLERIR